MKNSIRMVHGARIFPGVALALGISAMGGAAQAAAPGNWNDTFIGMRYSDDFYYPGIAEKVPQKIATLNSTGAFRYGAYTFNVDYLVSDKNNPEANGRAGAREIYNVSRVIWSAGKITGQPWSMGVVRDVGLTTGVDLNTKNDLYGSAGRTWIVGPTLEFDVPRGFWNVTVGRSKERNHNGIAHVDVNYKSSWRAESVWMAPLSLGPAQAVFKGFLAVTGPKGKDGFHVDTRTETLTRMSLMFDVGALAGHPRAFYLGPGYEYWKNMFGTPPSEAPGTRRSAATVNAEIHF